MSLFKGGLMNTGLTKEHTEKVSFGLSSVLADTYALYLQTQNFHWNVKGSKFYQLHALFEEQYTEMAEAIDDIAERIRALGFRAPGSFSEFQKLTTIKEVTGEMPADEMIKTLVQGHETITRKAREVIDMSSKHRDEGSADLLSGRITTHEKTTWMLKSLLEQ